jgi:hypothetical protein
MTRETKKIVAEGISDKLSIGELLTQKDLTKSSEIEAVIQEELENRSVCPDCGEDMFFDEKDSELYCPAGHHSHRI